MSPVMQRWALLPLLIALGIGVSRANPCAFTADMPGLRLDVWHAESGMGGTGNQTGEDAGSGMGGTGHENDGSGMGGTGKQAGGGMGGTGRQADGGMGGTGKQAGGGMGGTGKQAGGGMGGTGKQAGGGMGGTGKQAGGGMGGTGKQADGGMGGTGKQADGGMGGTGKQADGGMGGTGKQADGGMGGTGKQADGGMGGTGKQADGGMGGTGKQAGGGMGGTGRQADGGMGGTGVVGIITGFGSICVGGVELHYDADTPVHINGIPGSIDNLAVGQVVGVEARGSGDAMQALNIEVQHAVSGPVSWVSSSGETLIVLGQVVKASKMDTAGLNGGKGLQPGDPVQVSGLRGPDGHIQASRVDPSKPGDPLSVTGEVTGSAGNSLIIGGLAVQTDAQVAPGTSIRVTGKLERGVMKAETVKVAPELAFSNRVDRVLLQGVVKDAGDGQTLSLGYARIQAPAERIGQAGVKPGQVVRLEAVRRPDGALEARRIDVTPPPKLGDVPAGISRGAPGKPVREPARGGEHRGAKAEKGDKPLKHKFLESRDKPENDDKFDRTAVEKLEREAIEFEKPEIEKPEIEKPEIEKPEIEKPEIEKPEIEKPEIEKPEIEKPEIEKPEIEKPEIEKPEIEKPEIEKPEVEKPEVEKPEVEKPEVEKPEVEKPEVEKPEVEKPEVEKPEVEKPEVEKPEVEKPEVEKPEVEKPEVEKPEREDRHEVEVEKPETHEKPEKAEKREH